MGHPDVARRAAVPSLPRPPAHRAPPDGRVGRRAALAGVVLRFQAVSSETDIATAINALVDEYRTRCLWSLRADYYPQGTSEQLRILGVIERNGDLAAYQRASTLRKWLSRISSEASANS